VTAFEVGLILGLCLLYAPWILLAIAFGFGGVIVPLREGLQQIRCGHVAGNADDNHR